MKKIVLFMVMLAIASWGAVSQADVTLVEYVCGFYSTVNGDGHISNSVEGKHDWRISKNVAVYLDGEKSSLSKLENKPLRIEIELWVAPRENTEDRYEAITMRATTISEKEADVCTVPGQKEAKISWEKNGKK